MRQNRKRLLPFAGMLMAGALLLSSCQPTASAQTKVDANAEKVTVGTGSVENRIVATGKVVANAEAAVAFQRGGVVVAVLVSEGQSVKAGQPLAKLDTADLELTAKQQWANFLNAQASYSQTIKGPTSAELKAAQASLASAQSSAASAVAGKAKLFDEPTEAELLQAKAAYDAKFQQPTSADVASANAQISSANSQVQAARKSLEALQPISETVQQREAQMMQAQVAWQQAEANIKNTTLVAPFDGIVTAVNYDKGDYAGAGQAAVQIADFAVPLFEVDVDEADLGGVTVGQTARVRLQTYPNTAINAKVESISTVGTNNGSVVNYKVKLSLGKALDENGAEITGEPLKILINMSGTSEIVTAKTNDALVVPNTAITVDSQTKKYTVDILNADGTSKKVEVQLGYRDTDQTQIIQGVSAGDTLVIPSRSVQQRGPGPN